MPSAQCLILPLDRQAPSAERRSAVFRRASNTASSDPAPRQLPAAAQGRMGRTAQGSEARRHIRVGVVRALERCRRSHASAGRVRAPLLLRLQEKNRTRASSWWPACRRSVLAC